MEPGMTWDEFFMGMAFYVAGKSKDESTKVGAVIVGPDNEVVSIGFNGIPRGVRDYKSRFVPPEKYAWINHAERNAIDNAARVGQRLKGCHMYCTLPTCSDCAKGIVQSGLSGITIESILQPVMEQAWYQSWLIADMMMREAGVNVSVVSTRIQNIISARVSGVDYDLTPSKDKRNSGRRKSRSNQSEYQLFRKGSLS
jgi:dCMP deaminase